MSTQENKGLWLVAMVYGVLVGLAGVEHGIFEVLQGNIPTEGIMIDAIGDGQRFWPGAGERALTIVPNMLITGILAIVFGILVTVWSVRFMHKKNGALIFLILALILFLVGGGFAPIFLTILATIAATRIHGPLAWWRSHMPVKGALAKTHTGLVIIYIIIFTVAVGMQIFGAGPITAETTTILVNSFALVMVVLMPVVVLSGLSYDISAT